MEVGTLEMQRGQLGVGDADTCGILAGVEFRENPQPGLGGRVGDQRHDHVVADQRSAAPIAADVGELAMLDLVPLTRAGRHVTYVDGLLSLIASSCRATSHRRERLPLLPPPLAQISSSRGDKKRGLEDRPI